jgi:hypothetical protein
MTINPSAVATVSQQNGAHQTVRKARERSVSPSAPAHCAPAVMPSAAVIQRRSDGAERGRTRGLYLAHDRQHVGGEGVRAGFRLAATPLVPTPKEAAEVEHHEGLRGSRASVERPTPASGTLYESPARARPPDKEYSVAIGGPHPRGDGRRRIARRRGPI